MGMFDEFEHKNIICPHCNNEVYDIIQSKIFNCTLNFYKIGDIIETNLDIVQEDLRCEHCNQFFKIYLAFKDKIYLGAYNTKKDAENAINNINLIQLYKNQNKELVKKRELINKIRSKLYSINEYHFGNSTFISFLGPDLDYNIKTNLFTLLKFIEKGLDDDT